MEICNRISLSKTNLLEIIAFWYLVPSSLVSRDRHQGLTYCFHLQGKHWRDGGNILLLNVGKYKINMAVKDSTIFWDITSCTVLSTDVSEEHITSIFRALLANCFHAGFLLSLFFSTLNMETIYSSETSDDTQRTTWRYIPEDGTLHNHRCENAKSYNMALARSSNLTDNCDLFHSLLQNFSASLFSFPRAWIYILI
jgi:hypothetical protein